MELEWTFKSSWKKLVFMIYQLCSRSKDIDKELSLFHMHLLQRGYATNKLMPFFEKGINNTLLYLSQTQEQRDAVKKAKVRKSNERIFLHIPYHPKIPHLDSYRTSGKT